MSYSSVLYTKSCVFEGFPANPSQILPTFCHGNEVKPWKFEKKISKVIVRLTGGRKKGRKKLFLAEIAKNLQKVPKKNRKKVFQPKIFKGFTLVPWQKVGRIWLGFAGKHSNFKFSLFLPKSLANPFLPFPCIQTIRHQFNFFNFFLFDLVC